MKIPFTMIVLNPAMRQQLARDWRELRRSIHVLHPIGATYAASLLRHALNQTESRIQHNGAVSREARAEYMEAGGPFPIGR